MSYKDYEILSEESWPSFDQFTKMDIDAMGVLAPLLQRQIERDPKYHSSLCQYFTMPFPGLETIDHSYSQAWQDLFVLAMTQGKRNGTWLEVGASWPIFVNNTYLLSKFGWSGISIDISDTTKFWNVDRPTDRLIITDATKINYEELLSDQPFQIDYLQLDIDPQHQTLEVLKKLPHDKHRFSVITYETDSYIWDNVPLKHEARQIFADLGYELVIPDVVAKSRDVYGHGHNKWVPFEDWYVDPAVISAEVVQKIKQFNKDGRPSHFFINQDLHL
jgi:hypothetical protein